MIERGILFSAPMVRALLDGTKTQTRRIMKPQPAEIPGEPGKHWWPAKAFESMMRIEDGCQRVGAEGMAADASPFGAHGDHLWVRETFFAYGRWETRFSEKKKRDEWHFVDMTMQCDRAYQYAADNPDVPLAKSRGVTPGWYTRPAIFMPRAASRILLEIVSVRVERLQDISTRDAREEGLYRYPYDWRDCEFPLDDVAYEPFKDFGTRYSCASQAYRALWEHINGVGSWDANPWVWVVEFGRIG
jgi:hypothetical protein